MVELSGLKSKIIKYKRNILQFFYRNFVLSKLAFFPTTGLVSTFLMESSLDLKEINSGEGAKSVAKSVMLEGHSVVQALSFL